MALKLPVEIVSPQDLNSLMIELRTLDTWLAHEGIKQKIAGSTTAEPPVISPAASSLLNASKGSSGITRQLIENLINSLEEYAKLAQSMTVTLAAPANNKLRQSIVQWCRANIADDILITFRFNSTLLGGMVIRYKSQIFDWSLKRQILANRSKIPEIIRNV